MRKNRSVGAALPARSPCPGLSRLCAVFSKAATTLMLVIPMPDTRRSLLYVAAHSVVLFPVTSSVVVELENGLHSEPREWLRLSFRLFSLIRNRMTTMML